MKDLFDVLKLVKADDRQFYLDSMKFCDARVTADEGIPAVIGLDDLTRPESDRVFIPAQEDRDMGLLLAAKALLYASLYEEQYSLKSSIYPPICPAASCAIESCFRTRCGENGQTEVLSYREDLAEFISKKKA